MSDDKKKPYPPWSAGCEPRLFDREQLLAVAHERAFEPARRFFRGNALLLRSSLAARFCGFDEAQLRAGEACYGLHCWRADDPDVHFWFGLGWGPEDAPDRPPSWGVCLELDGASAEAFEADHAGLKSGWESIVTEHEELAILRMDGHIELAAWRECDWLLGADNQRLVLERFWIEVLDTLVSVGLPPRLAAFMG